MYRKLSHNKTLLMAHIILVTKYRKKLLEDELDEDVKQLIFEICCRHKWYIRKMESDKDHIHILLRYGPSDSISKIVSIIKQYTTYHIWRRYSYLLKREYWKENTFWSDGYFAASVGEASSKTIERYIENQG